MPAVTYYVSNSIFPTFSYQLVCKQNKKETVISEMLVAQRFYSDLGAFQAGFSILDFKVNALDWSDHMENGCGSASEKVSFLLSHRHPPIEMGVDMILLLFSPHLRIRCMTYVNLK